MNTETNISLRHIARVILPVFITTALFDAMFWDMHIGASFGVFFAGIALLILGLHQRTRPRWQTLLFVTMLAASCWQSAVQLSLSNGIACTGLALALAGTVLQPNLVGLWERITEVFYGLATSFPRWFGLAGSAIRSAGDVSILRFNIAKTLTKTAWVLAPAIVLLMIFTAVLSSGNSVFNQWLQHMDSIAVHFWEQLNLTPVRFLMWGFVATVALGIFHGKLAPEYPRWWIFTFPRVPRPDFKLAALQSGVALAALNGLFFIVNTIDAVYLWQSSEPPLGVNRSEFVHDGVNSLICAVVLSGIVIAGIFQQEDRVANNRWLKSLSHLWSLQNCVLIAGCFKRLSFYTHDYGLTTKRIHVAFFLILVAAGFALLAWFVQKRRTFNWLLGTNAVATFLLFFTIQFSDTAKWVARYNVGRWGRYPKKILDVHYLASLGPGAWPELIRVALINGDSSTTQIAKSYIFRIASENPDNDWRATQTRRAAAMTLIKDYASKHEPPPTDTSGPMQENQRD